MGATGPRRRGHLSLVPDLAEAGEPDGGDQQEDSGLYDGAGQYHGTGQRFGTARARRGSARLIHARYTLRITREEPGEDARAGSWRRILVQDDLRLDALHAVVCAALGWDSDPDPDTDTDGGRHAFISPAGTFAAVSRRIASSTPSPGLAREAETGARRGGAVHSGQLCLEDVLERHEESMICESVVPSAGGELLRRAVIRVERIEAAERTSDADPVLTDGRETGEEIDIAAGNARLRRLIGLREYEPAEGSAFAALLGRLPEALAPRFYSMLARMAADVAAEPSTLPGVDVRGPEQAVMHLKWLLRKIGPTTVDADGVSSGGIDLDLRGQMPKPIISKARKEICSPDRPRPRSLEELKNLEIVAVRKAAEDFGLTWMRAWPTEDQNLIKILELCGRPLPYERRLERTELGETLAEDGDGDALLRHVVTTLPFGDTDLERDDTLLWLAVLAAGISPPRQRAILAEAMAALGPDVEARTGWMDSSRNFRFMFAIDAVDWWEVGRDGLYGKKWAREFARMVLAQPEYQRR